MVGAEVMDTFYHSKTRHTTLRSRRSVHPIAFVEHDRFGDFAKKVEAMVQAAWLSGHCDEPDKRFGQCMAFRERS
jgi:hypothetical protein